MRSPFHKRRIRAIPDPEAGKTIITGLHDKNKEDYMNEEKPVWSDEDMAAAIVLQNWDEWVNSMDRKKHEQTKAERIFVLNTGCDAHSTAAMMFAAFEAGMTAGTNLAIRLDDLAEVTPGK